MLFLQHACNTSRFVTKVLRVKAAVPGCTVAQKISANCSRCHNDVCFSYKSAFNVQEHRLANYVCNAPIMMPDVGVGDVLSSICTPLSPIVYEGSWG